MSLFKSSRPLFLALLFVCVSANPSFAGGVDGGGGHVVRIDGHFRFLDTVSDQDLKRVDDLTSVENELLPPESFERSTFLIEIIRPMIIDGFESLRVDMHSLPNDKQIDLKRFTNALNVSDVMSPFRCFNSDEAARAGILPSLRTSPKNQLVVGWFDGENLYIQPYLFIRLSQSDQEAFLLHEAFRFYNHLGLEIDHTSKTAVELSTSDIEKRVSQIMGQIILYR